MLDEIFSISNDSDFAKIALQVYHQQAVECEPYRLFHQYLNKNHIHVNNLNDIPFLPIEFFKTHQIITGKNINSEVVFSSSGTTGQVLSKHYVTDLSTYIKSFMHGFEFFYGSIKDYCILALLPNYYEREGSSLVYMTNYLIEKSNHQQSGFYLHNIAELNNQLLALEAKGQKTILIGVSYALLDLIDKYQYQLKSTIIMETGGMKGKRKELLKSDLHQLLMNGFGVNSIHSEYGMTELLSQAYSYGSGLYHCPPWMNILVRDKNDPFQILESNYSGGINIIDLANINSCSFIATQDLGKVHDDGSFEILGRFDNSDIRGCNLMIQQ